MCSGRRIEHASCQKNDEREAGSRVPGISMVRTRACVEAFPFSSSLDWPRASTALALSSPIAVGDKRGERYGVPSAKGRVGMHMRCESMRRDARAVSPRRALSAVKVTGAMASCVGLELLGPKRLSLCWPCSSLSARPRRRPHHRQRRKGQELRPQSPRSWHQRTRRMMMRRFPFCGVNTRKG